LLKTAPGFIGKAPADLAPGKDFLRNTKAGCIFLINLIYLTRAARLVDETGAVAI
jgi:hypothetical protein